MDFFDDSDPAGPENTQSMPNIFGGEDVYHNGHLVHHTEANVMGGENVYDGSFHLQGVTMPNVFGGEDYKSYDNVHDIMSYDDPLSHASECTFAAFQPNHGNA